MKTKLQLPKYLAGAGLLAAAGLTLYAAPFFLPVTYQSSTDHQSHLILASYPAREDARPTRI